MFCLKLNKRLFSFLALVFVFAPNLVAQDLDETIRKGTLAMQSQKWDVAIKAFTEVTKAHPKDADAWFALGYSLHASGDLDKALPAHKKAVEFGFGEVKHTALYNIACFHSLKENPDKAFDYLEQSVEAGFVDTTQMKSDSDLANIRKDKRFDELIERVNNPLIGTWMASGGSRAGNKISSERLPLMTVTSKKMVVGEGDETFVFEYEIDKAESPMEIDLTITKSPMGQGAKAKGIIEFDRKRIKLCYNPDGSKRPKEFKATEENKFHSFTFARKAKPVEIGEWIVGNWNCVKGVRSGAEVAGERMATVITFTKDMITIPVDETTAFEMSYKIDASKKPVQIDMKIESGPAPEGTPAKGILKRDGDKFILCYDVLGGGRADKFESTKDNNYHYFEMKRK